MTGSQSGRSVSNAGITTSELTAIRVKDLRRRRGLTAAQLATRCAELGAAGMTTNVIANIETRRREISVNELMVFALALDVAPIHLLSPIAATDPATDRPLALTSTVQIEDPGQAMRWIHGEEALPVSQDRLYYSSSLENLRTPETDQTLSQYAKSVVMDGAKRLASQYEAQATQFQDSVRGQITEMLTGLEDAVGHGTSQSEVIDVLSDARTRLNAASPQSPPKAKRKSR
jgi:transcriptional regulator with XRE-family HTH domain